MDQSRLKTALNLLLVMIFLTLLASVLFAYQGRRRSAAELVQKNSQILALAGDNEQLQQTITAAAATRTAAEDARAAAETDAVLLEGQLVESQQRVDELATRTANLETNIQQLQEELNIIEPPQIIFAAPGADHVASVQETVRVMVAASDKLGITAVNLTIDTVTETFTGNDEPLFVAFYDWVPTAAGDYELSAMAINSSGLASEPITTTITIVPITREATAPNVAVRADIASNVQSLRGLALRAPLQSTIITRDQFLQRLNSDVASSITPRSAQFEAIALSAFDFVPPDFDLFSLYNEQLGTAVLGYYDPQNDELILVDNGDLEQFTPIEEWTYAHEVMHALQDQYFQLDSLGEELQSVDAQRALRALGEGEARLVQSLYVEAGYFTQAELVQIFTEQQAGATAETAADIPGILSAQFAFPYGDGFRFAEQLYDLGNDFSQIDLAWQNPPASTEHILHPERYLAGDMPQTVTLPTLSPLLGNDWVQVESNVFGEFMLREYLAQQLTAEQVETAATGWGGDRYAVYWQEASGNIVMILRIVWDSSEERQQFGNSYIDYPAALFGVVAQPQSNGGDCWQGDSVICLFQNGVESLIVRAPTLALAAEVVDLVNR